MNILYYVKIRGAIWVPSLVFLVTAQCEQAAIDRAFVLNPHVDRSCPATALRICETPNDIFEEL